MPNSFIRFIDRTLSGATTLGHSEPGSDGNERVLRIPQNSSITGASASDCSMSYPGHSLGEGILPLRTDAVGVFYSPSRLGYIINESRRLPTELWVKRSLIQILDESDYVSFGVNVIKKDMNRSASSRLWVNSKAEYFL